MLFKTRIQRAKNGKFMDTWNNLPTDPLLDIMQSQFH